MKKALFLCAFVLGSLGLVSSTSANVYLPDTDLITYNERFVVKEANNVGQDDVMPMWIGDKDAPYIDDYRAQSYDGTRYLSETDRISSGNHFVVLNRPEINKSHPTWIVTNPTCYTAQQTARGFIEAFVDNDTNTVYVLNNGRIVNTYQIAYDSSADFQYHDNAMLGND